MRDVTTSEGAESSDATWVSKPLPNTTAGNSASSARRLRSLSPDMSMARRLCAFWGCRVGELEMMVLLIGLSIHRPCTCCTGECEMSARQTFQHDIMVHSDTERWKMNFLSPASTQNYLFVQNWRWQDYTCTPGPKLKEGLHWPAKNHLSLRLLLSLCFFK